jgi:hypothetical protein
MSANSVLKIYFLYYLNNKPINNLLYGERGQTLVVKIALIEHSNKNH